MQTRVNSTLEELTLGLKTSESVPVGPPKLTRFEKARIVGARALQIALGAPILIKPPEGASSPIDIALYELEEGILPVTVRRRLPDGTVQDIPLQALIPPRKRRG